MVENLFLSCMCTLSLLKLILKFGRFIINFLTKKFQSIQVAILFIRLIFQMRLSYIVQGKASIFIEKCTADQCSVLKEINGDSEEVEWMTAAINVSSVQGR